MSISARSPTKPIDVIEAAYDLRGTTEQWLRRLLAALGDDLDCGLGTYAFIGRFEERRIPLASAVVGRRVAPDLLALARRVNGAQDLPVGIYAHIQSRVVELGGVLEAFGGAKSATAQQMREHAPVHDSFSAWAQDGERGLVQFLAISRQMVRTDERVRAAWRKVLLHVGTALRLRQRLAQLKSAPDALLSTAATVTHAEGAARDRPARDALVAAVKRIERARTARIRREGQSAVELWQGLVDGRWSLVDHFEADGRRYIAAHENAPALPDPRGLGAWERACLHYFLRGASTEEIAFTLGRSPHAVGRALSSVLPRLGFPNRAALRRAADQRALERLLVELPSRSRKKGEMELLDVLVVPSLLIHPSWLKTLGDVAIEVATLAADGLSDREIAARRGVSVRTVSNQLRKLYQKLGVRCRSDLVTRLEKASAH